MDFRIFGTTPENNQLAVAGRRHGGVVCIDRETLKYEGWNFNSGNYLFTTDTK